MKNLDLLIRLIIKLKFFQLKENLNDIKKALKETERLFYKLPKNDIGLSNLDKSTLIAYARLIKEVESSIKLLQTKENISLKEFNEFRRAFKALKKYSRTHKNRFKL